MIIVTHLAPRAGARCARARALLAVLVALAGACGGASMQSLFPSDPRLESRCRVGASQTSVLVTEWPAAEKANLEAMQQGGAVAVAFSGCAMRVLPQCRLGGRHVWQRTTPSADLHAKLPLGALAPSGELSRSGSLYVLTTVAGQTRLEGMTGADVPGARFGVRPIFAPDGRRGVLAGLGLGGEGPL